MGHRRPLRISKFLPVLAVLLLSSEATTSERQRQVSLEDVVAQAQVIIVARPASPATKLASIPITEHPEAPAFEYAVQRWTVEEILYVSGNEGSRPLMVTNVLEVEPANLSYDLAVHIARHVRGVNKITLREVYTPAKTPKGPARLVFLRHGNDGYQLTVRGAVEAVALKARVLELLRAKRTGEGRVE